jgi:hypothetical protein
VPSWRAEVTIQPAVGNENAPSLAIDFLADEVRLEPGVMTLTRHRSIRNITAFRERYFADHPDATWNDAGLAYVMTARKRHEDESAQRTELRRQERDAYAEFVESARTFARAETAAPRRVTLSSAPALAWLKPA